MPEVSIHDVYRVTINQRRMAATRALEWIGTSNTWLVLDINTVNFRLVVQKCNIEFQIDQSHSAKLSGLPNAIGQFTFQYCVFVDNQLETYGIRLVRKQQCYKGTQL